ncbi:hypothetical protein SpCBS45565_g05683 [Spizellomyces sp. 'palustris']|nr:hypothetical protein SpCBS45565_g05683 [Spizellomyces sp. 'palustris']
MTEGTSQTEPVTTAETACQVLRKLDVDVQTDPEPIKSCKLLTNYDRGSMVDFLAKVESTVSVQLLQNIKSTAFDGWSAHWEDSVNATTLQHTLSHSRRDPSMLCSDLSWNKNGITIAVAFGKWGHESWCSHKGMLCTWSLATKSGADEPAFELEVESCLMCISFHPMDPSLIVGGTFNGTHMLVETRLIPGFYVLIPFPQGQVFVCRTNDTEDDPIIAASRMSDLTHQEPVAKIAWIPGPKVDQYQIVSIGNDGKVLIWDLANKLAAPISGSQLQIGSIPRHLRTGGPTKPDAILGGTTISFPPENPTIYLTGTEAGYIAKCSRSVSTTIPPNTVSLPRLANPIQFAYTPHTGPVTAMACSPFHRNLFLSCGSDGLVRIYNVLQTKQLSTFEPSQSSIYCADWSPVRATVFACTSSDGLVYIYDLAHNPTLPHTTLEGSGKASVACTSLTFNAKRPEYLATGDGSGEVRIWRLSTQLASSNDVWQMKIVETLGGLDEREGVFGGT